MKRDVVGDGAFASTLTLLEEMDPSRVFLVTGKRSYEKSAARELLASFLSTRAHSHFWEFAANPKIEDVRAGVDMFRERPADLILAVGGGSVIDMAKLINAMSHNDGLEQMVRDGNVILKNKGKLLAAIPTTAGSGSEATRFAVLYMDGVKYSLSHPCLEPQIVAVDPLFSSSMPPYLTAASGFDALGQAVESLWAVGATDESRKYAEAAISIILSALEQSVTAPTHEDRLAMAKGAHLAGKAINISKTTIAHALSYHLTSKYGVAHGHAVALIMSRFLAANSGLSGTPLEGDLDRLHTAFERICSLFGQPNPVQCEKAWLELMIACGLEHDLAKLGLKSDSQLTALVRSVNAERFGNNPIRYTETEMLDLLKQTK